MARRVGGLAELLRQIKEIAPRRKRGRPRGSVGYDFDNDMLLGIETIYRVANRDRGMKRQEVIGWLFDDMRVTGTFGASRAAL
jgi:hypothetical protein